MAKTERKRRLRAWSAEHAQIADDGVYLVVGAQQFRIDQGHIIKADRPLMNAYYQEMLRHALEALVAARMKEEGK